MVFACQISLKLFTKQAWGKWWRPSAYFLDKICWGIPYTKKLFMLFIGGFGVFRVLRGLCKSQQPFLWRFLTGFNFLLYASMLMKKKKIILFYF